MRGRTAWNLLETEWGRTVADALWRGKRVRVAASNGNIYMLYIRENQTRLWNETTGEYYCIHVNWQYPLADRAITLLEHIRAAPEVIEGLAGRHRHEF